MLIDDYIESIKIYNEKDELLEEIDCDPSKFNPNGIIKLCKNNISLTGGCINGAWHEAGYIYASPQINKSYSVQLDDRDFYFGSKGKFIGFITTTKENKSMRKVLKSVANGKGIDLDTLNKLKETYKIENTHREIQVDFSKKVSIYWKPTSNPSDINIYYKVKFKMHKLGEISFELLNTLAGGLSGGFVEFEKDGVEQKITNFELANETILVVRKQMIFNK